MKKLLAVAACLLLSFGVCSVSVAQPGLGSYPERIAPPPPPRPTPRPDMGPDHHRPNPIDCRMCDDMRRHCHHSPHECDIQYNRCLHACRPMPPAPPAPHRHVAPPPPAHHPVVPPPPVPRPPVVPPPPAQHHHR